VGERDRGGQVPHPRVRALRIALVDAALHGARCLGSMGSWLNVPIRFERVYEDYEVEGGTPPDPESKFIPRGRSGVTPTGTCATRPITDPELHKAQVDSANKAMRACIDSVTKKHRQGRGGGGRAPGKHQGVSPSQAGRDAAARCAAAGGANEDSVLTVIIPKDTMSIPQQPRAGPAHPPDGRPDHRGRDSRVSAMRSEKTSRAPWDPRAQGCPTAAMSGPQARRAYNPRRGAIAGRGCDPGPGAGTAQGHRCRIGIAQTGCRMRSSPLVRTAPIAALRGDGIPPARRPSNPDTRPFWRVSTARWPLSGTA
jgi:hypothetical protein